MPGASSHTHTTHPSGPTLLVAASDAHPTSKRLADFIAAGIADDVQIQAAIDALPASGGKVVLSEGTFDIDAAVTVNKNDVHIEGQGTGVTIVRTTTAGIFAFDFGDGATTRFDLSLSTLNIDSTVTKTAGAAVRFNQCDRVAFTDFYIASHFIGVDIQNCHIVSIRHGSITDTVVTTGISLRVDTGDHFYITEVICDAPNGSQPFAGLRLLKQDDAFITDCDFLHQGRGVLIDPQGTDIVDNLFMARVSANLCGTNGYLILPASGATARSLHFVDCWGSENSSTGFETGGAGTIQGITLELFRAFINDTHGILINTGIDTLIRGCQIAGNSVVSSGVSSGIAIGANVDNFRIESNRSGAAFGRSDTQDRGIRVVSGTSDNYMITGNDVRTNVNSGILDQGSGSTKEVHANIGYVTENSGIATILDTNTSVTVTHGLDVTPTLADISIIMGEDPTNAINAFWVDTITSTQFNINSNDPGASNLDVAWKAIVL